MYRVTRCSSVTGASILLLLSGLASAQSRIDRRAVEQIQALIAEKQARTPAQRRVDSQLLLELKRRRGDAIARSVPRLETGITTAADGSTVVDIRARVTPALVAHIESLGGTVLGQYARYNSIRARVPLAGVETLAGANDVSFLRPATRPITNMSNVSEGDVAHVADRARDVFGVDGSGVNICALSDSVDHLAAVQASGDLPAVRVLRGQRGSPGSGEGTAMLEIIHDLAPGADLSFATAFNGEASFATNIIALRSSGCDVIVDDVFYLTEPVFQDGIIARAVETVIADGAIYFSSAGNAGNLNDGTSGVWEGDFASASSTPTPLGSSEVHDFGGSHWNTVTVDSPFFFSLQWADPQGGSANDYDLYLLDPSGTAVEAASTNVQNGNDDPFEEIDSGAFDDTGSHLVIVRNTGASARYLHLNTHRGRLGLGTDGQLAGHPAVVDAFAVAAVDVADASGSGGEFTGSESVETFSSDGPRRVFFESDGTALTPGNFSSSGGEVRSKPDVAAADGVVTATPGFSRFFGTSAAAPHAAAIAGLLLEAEPSLTSTSLRALLEETSLDIGSPGFDRDSGIGILDAFAALQRVAGTSTDVSISITDVNDPVAAGGVIKYSLSVANAGPDTAGNVISTQTLPPGIPLITATTSRGACNESAGTVTCTFGDLAAGSAVNVTVAIGPAAVGTVISNVSVSSETLDDDPSNNTAIESTTVSPSDLRLAVDAIDHGSYGNGFGTDDHPTSLLATFVGNGTSTYLLQVTGYDIDSNTEVSVHVNGSLVGHLQAGANNGLNGGDVFELPPTVTVIGLNTIEFRTVSTGRIWGIVDVGVLTSDPRREAADVNLVVDTIDDGAYGNGFGTNAHRTSLTASFNADGETTYYLQVFGYDVDLANEVSVRLDGILIGNLAVGPNNALNAGNVFELSPAVASRGIHVLEFRERNPGWVWGVTDIGILTSPPVRAIRATDAELTINEVDTGAYGKRFGTNANPKRVTASFVADGSSIYLLDVAGFDINSRKEVTVRVNGKRIGWLRRGKKNELNRGNTFTLTPELTVAGINAIEFRQKKAGRKWGVTAIAVRDPDTGLR